MEQQDQTPMPTKSKMRSGESSSPQKREDAEHNVDKAFVIEVDDLNDIDNIKLLLEDPVLNSKNPEIVFLNTMNNTFERNFANSKTLEEAHL